MYWYCVGLDGAMALLFKVLTVFNLSPQSSLSEELQSGQFSPTAVGVFEGGFPCRGQVEPA